MNNLIATSRRGQMRALAVQGIFATDCHAQLRGLILRHLSPAHAALLAEPQHDAQKQGIDWYADLPGRPVRCADLPENEAQALRARAATLARDISETARRLRETSGHEHGLSGALLALVPLHATEDDLWSVDGQPVLINWGFAPGGPGAEAQDLTRLGSAPAPAPTPAVAAAAPVVPPAGGGRGCLWWLLPLLLLLLLLWLLPAALGLLPSPLPGGCVPAPDTAALDKEKARTAPLENELQELLHQLRERADQCRPPVSPPPAVKPETPRPEPEIVEPFLGETPKEEPKPEPKAEPKPEPKPEQPKPKPRKGDDMTIPDDAAKKQDLSFLEGCWVSETGLYSHPSNLPLVAEYCFDKNGRGRRFAREKGGRVCSGPAQARFRNGKLYFEADYAACPRGSRFVPQQVECTGSDNRTHCRGKELKEGHGTTWDARFKRK